MTVRQIGSQFPPAWNVLKNCICLELLEMRAQSKHFSKSMTQIFMKKDGLRDLVKTCL